MILYIHKTLPTRRFKQPNQYIWPTMKKTNPQRTTGGKYDKQLTNASIADSHWFINFRFKNKTHFILFNQPSQQFEFFIWVEVPLTQHCIICIKNRQRLTHKLSHHNHKVLVNYNSFSNIIMNNGFPYIVE